MTMYWLKLWNELPNDPKLRTIARKAKVGVSVVLAVYLHVLVNANTNPNPELRGKTHHLDAEDLGNALDLDTEQVAAVLAAMEGRLINKTLVMGWEKRQENPDVGAAERSRQRRERDKLKLEAARVRTEPHACARPARTDKEGEGDLDLDEEKGESATAPDSPPLISPEFKNILQTERPDLQAEVVFAKFAAFFPPLSRTEKTWRGWVQNERLHASNAPPATADPDSMASIQTLGLSLGLGKWDRMAEPWANYKARVKGVTA